MCGCMCVCLRVGPMGVGCAGCCSIFGEVESQGFVAESFSTHKFFALATQFVLFARTVAFYSFFLLARNVLYAIAQILSGSTVWY